MLTETMAVLHEFWETLLLLQGPWNSKSN